MKSLNRDIVGPLNRQAAETRIDARLVSRFNASTLRRFNE